MIPLQNMARQWFIRNQATVDNDDPVGARGDANPNTVDTAGYDYMVVTIAIGFTDVALAALALYASDDGVAVGADDANFTLQSDLAVTGSNLPSATDDNTEIKLFVNLKGRDPRRYWILECLCGNGTSGTNVCAWADLYSNETLPNTAAARGSLYEIIV